VSTAEPKHSPGKFRPDVEGLRAIAVAMVLLYHVGFGWASGGFAGVDVFFVISGFLITSQLATEADATGTVSLTQFYARRAKRIFPAAALVLLATIGLALAFIPKTRWAEIGGDVFSSAAYFTNWRLASRSVDYLAEDSTPSPVQHFWSLAVEEQYYIVWPLLIVGGLFVARRWLRPRTILWILLGLLALPSLAYSVYLTQLEPGTAYFVTPTRMWELAIGGAVALGAHYWPQIPPKIALALGWSGLAGIVVATFFVTAETAWPGYAASLPTLGTAAVIVGGSAAGARGPVAVLGTAPFRWVGGISYSLYLWHWPLILVATAALGTLPTHYGLALIALSVVLAWVTLKLVENPIRYSSTMSANPKYALSSGLNFSFLGASAGLGLMLFASAGAGTAGASSAKGAAVLAERPRNDPAGAPVDNVPWMTPLPTMATQDVPDLYGDGCQVGFSASKDKPCVYGRKDGKLTIALVGDSKIGQWLPALQILAEKNDWRILVETKSACGFNSGKMIYKGKPYTACFKWNRAALKSLLGPNKPDVVLTSQGRSAVSEAGASSEAEPEMVAALQDWWKKLQKAGVKVIALADNPAPSKNVYECATEHPDKLTLCAFPRNEGRGTPALRQAVAKTPGTSFIDLTDAICPTDKCAPVIGNVLVYRQGSHLTKTYVETLAPRLERELKKLIKR
jgi:peptidoglycan/LPS O-acetylase OafA/YrhL